MHFVKMHGLGNDYIYVDCFKKQIENPEQFAILMSRQHVGIGADGLILIMPAQEASCRMVMFNADGSRGKMCGNGIRCVGKYVAEHYPELTREAIIGTNDRKLTVETDSGIRHLICHYSEEITGDEGSTIQSVTVDMGQPSFFLKDVGVDVRMVHRSVIRWRDIWYSKLHIDGEELCGTGMIDGVPVSMGNPHLVTFWNELDSWPDVAGLGERLENLECFADRTNVEFVRVEDRGRIKVRVWERGSQETLACGTGACAAVAVCVTEGLTEPRVSVELPGGTLIVQCMEDMHIWMTGTATTVFEGDIDWRTV